MPLSEYKAAKAHIHQLLEAQVIQESSSPFASPKVLVKKDGSLRLRVDYRLLNSKTRKDAFPLPLIESLDALSGAHWFSTWDLATGCQSLKRIKLKGHSALSLACSSGTICHFGCAMPRARS